jgi:hypothetical protein
MTDSQSREAFASAIAELPIGGEKASTSDKRGGAPSAGEK